jgi:hypothetical protein
MAGGGASLVLPAPTAVAEQLPIERLAAVAEALTIAARLRFGRSLADDQVNNIRTNIERGLILGELVKQGLNNSNPPAFGLPRS